MYRAATAACRARYGSASLSTSRTEPSRSGIARRYDHIMSTNHDVPSLFEWAGGHEAIERLFVRFYQRVPDDPLLRDVFAHMDPAHAQHVAAFVSEVFGGPAAYSQEHGGHPHMIRK